MTDLNYSPEDVTDDLIVRESERISGISDATERFHEIRTMISSFVQLSRDASGVAKFALNANQTIQQFSKQLASLDGVEKLNVRVRPIGSDE